MGGSLRGTLKEGLFVVSLFNEISFPVETLANHLSFGS